MQVPFGSQLLQTFGRIMDSMHVSSAVIFVDLSNAFHKLVRELVSGVHVPSDVEAVLEQLLFEGIPISDLVDLLQLPSLLQKLDVPPFLQQLIQDLHTHTWMLAPGSHQPIITRKGTRPGSPLADCIFHVLMADVASEINQIISSNAEFQQILQRADLLMESVIWADDVAIPIAAEEAQSLPAAIECTLQQVHHCFQKRGFTFNLQKGKTSVVATFRGPGAPLMRAKHQLCSNPGMQICLGAHEVFIHFMPSYKHLGTMFSSCHTLDQEIMARIGTAKSAFAKVAKPILCNRHIPEATRTKLFKSLIESRLFYGLGAWTTPTARQMNKLQAALTLMLRKLFRMSTEEISTTTVPDLFQRANICSPRARLAVDRLMYAQRVWQFGPEMLQHAIHREDALVVDSWMLGLKHDLCWLFNNDKSLPVLQTMPPPASPADLDLTVFFDLWQSGSKSWKVCVQRACRRFRQQEGMMCNVLAMHKAFFRVFLQAGATFEPSPFCSDEGLEHTFVCHCGKSFTTAQGLACHKRSQHGEYAPERQMIGDATCPECLRYFWTKQRLYQHLSYVSRKTKVNQCFQALKRKGFCIEPEPGDYHKFPPAVKGLARIETLQAFGPRAPLVDVTNVQIDAAQKELRQIDQELQIDKMPTDPEVSRQEVRRFLTSATHEWFNEFCQNDFDEELAMQLPDRWLACLFQFDADLDICVEAEILDWGQHCLADILEGFADGVAERLVDDAFADLGADLPRQQLLSRRAWLVTRCKVLEEEHQQVFPHRSVKYGTATARERAITAAIVPSRFEDQFRLLQVTTATRWFDLPPERTTPFIRQPTRPKTFVIAHLFSGRRRVGDVHERLHFWAEHYGLDILVLSLDTANSAEFGNLHHCSVTWKRLLELYKNGCISATLTGAPCETWSAARHSLVVQANDEGKERPCRHMPRPLRDAERVFGRQQLTPRELRQLQQGSLFFMQTLITMAWSIVTGALYLSEHPAIPMLEEAASVWKTPWIQLLCSHPDVVLHFVGQWKWGCSVCKPTGLLAIKLPRFNASMYSRQDSNAKKPDQVAIGIGENGKFRTSAHKEYPTGFCNALAGTILDELYRCHRHNLCRESPPRCTELLNWLEEASAHCSVLRDTEWLPDYQGG